jgi:hypothetical protein
MLKVKNLDMTGHPHRKSRDRLLLKNDDTTAAKNDVVRHWATATFPEFVTGQPVSLTGVEIF